MESRDAAHAARSVPTPFALVSGDSEISSFVGCIGAAVAEFGSVVGAEWLADELEFAIGLRGAADAELMIREIISRNKILLADWLSRSAAFSISISPFCL